MVSKKKMIEGLKVLEKIYEEDVELSLRVWNAAREIYAKAGMDKVGSIIVRRGINVDAEYWVIPEFRKTFRIKGYSGCATFKAKKNGVFAQYTEDLIEPLNLFREAADPKTAFYDMMLTETFSAWHCDHVSSAEELFDIEPDSGSRMKVDPDKIFRAALAVKRSLAKYRAVLEAVCSEMLPQVAEFAANAHTAAADIDQDDESEFMELLGNLPPYRKVKITVTAEEE